MVTDLLDSHGVRIGDVDHWAIHPGGPKVVDAVGRKLGLDDSALAASWHVLRRHGNCSSATVLLVLDELLRAHEPQRGDDVVALRLRAGPHALRRVASAEVREDHRSWFPCATSTRAAAPAATSTNVQADRSRSLATRTADSHHRQQRRHSEPRWRRHPADPPVRTARGASRPSDQRRSARDRRHRPEPMRQSMHSKSPIFLQIRQGIDEMCSCSERSRCT